MRKLKKMIDRASRSGEITEEVALSIRREIDRSMLVDSSRERWLLDRAVQLVDALIGRYSNQMIGILNARKKEMLDRLEWASGSEWELSITHMIEPPAPEVVRMIITPMASSCYGFAIVIIDNNNKSIDIPNFTSLAELDPLK